MVTLIFQYNAKSGSF